MNEELSIAESKKGEREKRLIAFSSVVAAVFLTSMKLAVGLITGSLGILSEAAHSGLDLIAAAVTFFAVRASDRPADEEHLYGHGKIENFSALVETILLFVTCIWIIYEAVQRLFFRSVIIEVSAWSFVIMVTSILIDVTRSRALMRTAKKYNSQALEADALHFATDVWSSSVVIFGLIAVLIGQSVISTSPVLGSWLFRADAVAALGVSVIVIRVSWQLGKRTVLMLLDAAPWGIHRQIKDLVENLPGITEVTNVRVRQSGPTMFVDMTINVPRQRSLTEAHEISEQVEKAVRELSPRSDVIVHVQPDSTREGNIIERVRGIAGSRGIEAHDLAIDETEDGKILEMHIEVPDDLTVAEAHQRASDLEQLLKLGLPDLKDIVVHIDPVGGTSLHRTTSFATLSAVQDAVTQIAGQVVGISNCHSVTVLRESGHVSVSFHCAVPADYSIVQAHEMSDKLEALLRKKLHLGRVTIHIEPEEGT